MGKHSDFLFTNSNFFAGMGSSVNLAGNYFEYNVSPNGTIADIRAIYNDFAAIEEDLEDAMCEITCELIEMEEDHDDPK